MTEETPDDTDPDDAADGVPEVEGGDEHVEPDVPTGRETSRGGKVLTPDELDIAESEYVAELDDSGRFVVSPGGGPPSVARSTAESGSPDSGRDRRERPGDSDDTPDGTGGRASSGPASPEAARTLLAEELGRANARYGIDVVGLFDGEPVRHRTVSNDVVATFEGLVQWYAQHVAADTPADEVIEILLNEADLTGPSTGSLAELLEDHDLDTSDSIEDLVAAIDAETDASE